MPRNNPIHYFDHYEEIETWLREQWAGYFRELLKENSSQKQLSTLSNQVYALSEINKTLKRYLEETVSKVNPDQSEIIIKEENQRLKPWLVFEIVKKDYGFYGGNPPDIPTYYLYAKNVGNGVALDINFQVYLDNQKQLEESSLGSLSPREQVQIMGLPESHGKVEIREIGYIGLNETEIVQEDVFLEY